jgi:hypothetical protein
VKWGIHVASKARWFKYSGMEALGREDSGRLSGLRGLERPPVVGRGAMSKDFISNQWKSISHVELPTERRKKELQEEIEVAQRSLELDDSFKPFVWRFKYMNSGPQRDKMIERLWRQAFKITHLKIIIGYFKVLSSTIFFRHVTSFTN